MGTSQDTRLSPGMCMHKDMYTQVSQRAFTGRCHNSSSPTGHRFAPIARAQSHQACRDRAALGKMGGCDHSQDSFLPLFHKCIKAAFSQTTWKSPPHIWNLAEDLSLPLLLRNSIKALSGTDEWMSQPILLFVLKKKSIHQSIENRFKEF